MNDEERAAGERWAPSSLRTFRAKSGRVEEREECLYPCDVDARGIRRV
jgi:hypothetical protein